MLSEAIDVLEISCSFQGVTVLILMSATIPSTRKKNLDTATPQSETQHKEPPYVTITTPISFHQLSLLPLLSYIQTHTKFTPTPSHNPTPNNPATHRRYP